MTPFRISLAAVGAVAALGTGAAFATSGPTALTSFLNHGDAVSAAAKACPESTATDRDAHGDCVSAVAKSEAGEKANQGKHKHDADKKHKATTGADTDKKGVDTDKKVTDTDKDSADSSNHGLAVSTVAKSTPTGSEAHGDAVSAVASSNAEKNGASHTDSDTGRKGSAHSDRR